jgi:transcriptional regulator with XRE-family HTH domain
MPYIPYESMSPDEIRKLRHARGWTQRELAEKLRVTVVTVGRYEMGFRKPRPDIDQRLRRFARRLNGVAR